MGGYMGEDTLATTLFGLDGVDVVEVDTEPDHSTTVYVQTAGVVRCPDCATVASVGKQRVTCRPRDLPYGGRRVRVVWSTWASTRSAGAGRGGSTTRTRARPGNWPIGGTPGSPTCPAGRGCWARSKAEPAPM
jgi:hypothetical protein